MRANRFGVLISLFWSFFSYSSLLMASTGEGFPWEDRLTRIANSLTGPVAKAGGMIAIVGAGLALSMNQSDGFSRTAIRIVFGLSIAFSAGTWGLSFFGYGSGFLIP